MPAEEEKRFSLDRSWRVGFDGDADEPDQTQAQGKGARDRMSKTMKAALIRAFGEPLVIDEVPTPEPGASQVLVRIVATGVCHTDLHAVDGDWAIKPEIPLIPGHEGVGYVAALGAGVTSLKEGDRVGVFWLNRTCGHCEFCLSGREMICPKQINTGFATNGTYADYVLADANYVRPIPEDADFAETAPIFCAGLTTYKGLKQTEALPGQWVAVLGVGGLGHLAVQYARAMGFRVIALDISEEKRSLARDLGADLVIDAADKEAVRRIRRETGGGCHGALVTAPAVAAFSQGLGVLRRGGTCVMNGLPDGEFPVAVMGFVQKGLTVRGALVGSRQDLNEALEFVAQGKVRATIEVEPFERVNEVLDRLRRGEVKGRAVLNLSN